MENLALLKDFKGKNAVIIGGTGGIGLEIALALGKKGCNLILQGRHEESRLKNLEGTEGKIQQIVHNIHVENKDWMETFLNSAIMKYIKNADILCVCLGPFLQCPIHETTVAQWQQIVNLNYTFPGILVSEALTGMKKRGFGRIILFGGTGTDNVSGFRTNAVYAGAKTALCSLVKSVALEYTQYGITCNGILPAQVETEYLSKENIEKIKAKMPTGKLIDGKTVAETVVFLLEHPDFSGSLINIDGGWQRQ